jgi:hypothetical protein
VAGRAIRGEAGRGAGLDRIGLLWAEERSAVVFVALGIAAGQGEREGRGRAGGSRVACSEAVQEVEHVVGVLPGRVETNDELDRP